MLELNNCKWSQHLYRVGIPDWHPEPEKVRRAFASGKGQDCDEDDLRLLIIERTSTPYDLSENPKLQKIIQERCPNVDELTLPVPLGMVRWISKAFDHYLNADGKMIIGDVGTYSTEHSKVGNIVSTNTGARYKCIDFLITQRLLEERGLKATVISVKDLLNKDHGGIYDPSLSSLSIEMINSDFEHVMIVERK